MIRGMTFPRSVGLYQGFRENRAGGVGYMEERGWPGNRGIEMG